MNRPSKDGTVGAVGEVAAEEAGGGRRPDHHVDVAAFGADPGPPPGPVEVFRVEG